MEFPAYSFKEYPKWVNNDDRHPETNHGMGVLVNSKREEEEVLAKIAGAELPVETEVEGTEEEE